MVQVYMHYVVINPLISEINSLTSWLYIANHIPITAYVNMILESDAPTTIGAKPSTNLSCLWMWLMACHQSN